MRLKRKPREASIWTVANDSVLLLPLHMALLRKAPIEVVQAIMEKNPHASHQPDSFGMMPLHLACQSGLSLDIVQFIAGKYPAACQQLDETLRTPLHLACASHALRFDVISFLLGEHPQAVEVKDRKGYIPEEYVGPHPHQARVLRELRRGTQYWTASSHTKLSCFVVQRKWNKALDHLQSFPEDASQWVFVNDKRYFPLHLACRHRAPPDVIAALLKANPDANRTACQEFGMLPLHMACQYGSSDSVVQLLLASCEASLPDEQGLLPLHLVCAEGSSVAVVRALLRAHPQGTLSKDARGFTPMVYAKASKHPNGRKVVELMVQSIHDKKDEQGPAQPGDEGPAEPQRKASSMWRQQSAGLPSRPSTERSVSAV